MKKITKEEKEYHYLKKEKERISLFHIGSVFFGILVAVFVLITIINIPIPHYGIPCIFHSITGYNCPGCGGTRAVFALFHGHFLESLQYNAFVLYGVVLYACFMVTNMIQKISKDRLKIGMHYYHFYIIIGIILMFAQCTYKNILIFNNLLV